MAERFFKATGERELRISVFGKVWAFKPNETQRVTDDRVSSYFILHKGLREVDASGAPVTPDVEPETALTKKTFKSGLSPKVQGLPTGVKVANFNGRKVMVKPDGTFDIPKDMQTSAPAKDEKKPQAKVESPVQPSEPVKAAEPPKTGPRSKKKFEPIAAEPKRPIAVAPNTETKT